MRCRLRVGAAARGALAEARVVTVAAAPYRGPVCTMGPRGLPLYSNPAVGWKAVPTGDRGLRRRRHLTSPAREKNGTYELAARREGMCKVPSLLRDVAGDVTPL